MLSGDRNDYADDFTNTRLHELPVYIKYRFSETDFHMNYHFHRGYELFFLHEGWGAYINDDYVHPFQGNDLILIEGRQIHRASPTIGRRFTRTVINFLPECLIPETKQLVHDLFGKELENENRHLLLSEEKHARIYALLHQIHAEYTERHTGFQHMIGILLTRLLQDIHRIRFSDRPPPNKDTAEENPTIHDIIDYLSSHYAENILLVELAKRFYITPYYLCRLFKKATGDTIGRFITYARIRQAKQELVFTDMSISEICTRVGYGSFSYFGLVFKQYEGMTPRQYRQSYKRSINR
ncbi:helix-turn-helix transcriptional regulator [Paenibacillus ginsengarvi]|uniref:helix-turn-helix transcriptional regulator n=1 Tax=Paenibacillus ginsengarvi TaxID=400777 RepID=UPI0013157907|nr:AraC family transcriptional regulator [Paenibacillus ginsengarvi]